MCDVCLCVMYALCDVCLCVMCACLCDVCVAVCNIIEVLRSFFTCVGIKDYVFRPHSN